MIRATLTALSATLLLACTAQPGEGTGTGNAPQQAATASVHPESGLPLAPLKITQGGKTHNFTVELARSEEEQRQGLMFRRELGPNEGMLFPYDNAEIRGFWMKNTVIPLDIIFIGPDKRIINTVANAEPYSLQTRVSLAPAMAVLELPGGRAAELGLEPGALVAW